MTAVSMVSPYLRHPMNGVPVFPAAAMERDWRYVQLLATSDNE
jgi:hypothetical protein